MNVWRLSSVLVALGLVLTVVPAASAGHLDEKGDRVEFDYVEAIPDDGDGPFPDQCTDSEDPLLDPLDDIYTSAAGDHYTTPVVEGGLCLHLDDRALYEVTAQSDSGDPMLFEWYVLATKAPCQARQTVTGSVVVEITTETGCNYLVTDLDEDPSRFGTVAVERLS